MRPEAPGPRPSARDDSGHESTVAGPLCAGYWAPSGRPKYSRLGVERVVHPRETIRRTAPLLEQVGVTRLADVGRLDRSGLPNYVAVCPRRSEQGISYYNGKGATRQQARAGAVMEAIERLSGERCALPSRVASYSALSREARAIDPTRLLVPRVRDYSPTLEIQWILGFNLIDSEPTYVPRECVVFAEVTPGFPRVFLSSTNGLASGNTIEEALCHALCELIERDSMALHDAAVKLRRSLGGLLSGAGVAYDPSPSRTSRRIDLEGLPPRALRILRRLREGGLAVHLRDITSDIGIATIACTLVESRLEGWVAHAGYGCHPDARVALTRALTEAYQSRIACIQGGREDLPRLVSERAAIEDPQEIHGAGPSVPFAQVRSVEHETVGEDVLHLLDALKSSGLTEVVAFDMTDAEVGIPVVRVVVPGLECWSVFSSHIARAVLGPRSLGLLQ